MASEDPFLEVQSDVQALLSQTRPLYSSYLRIRTLTSTKSKQATPELLQTREELTNNLTTLASDLADLTDAIQAVEADPYAFGVDVAEVSRRKGFIREVGGEIESMRAEIQGSGSANGISNGNALPDPDSFHHDDDDAYEEFEREQQQTMFREQDEALDDVYRTVGNLRGQAEDMGRELEEQGHMLDEVDTLADRVGGKLAVGTKKIGEVIRANEDKWSGFCIGALIFVLCLLLFLVIVI